MEKILKNMWSALRKYVRLVLENSKDSKELLTEPDSPPEDEESQEEASAGGVAGVTTPLGTGPTYPSKKKKKSKKKKSVVGDDNWYKSK